MRCAATGPSNAHIAIVGEAPGQQEEAEGIPFVGTAGNEFNGELRDAGLSRDQCFITNVCMDRPHDNEIKRWIAVKKDFRDGSEVHYRGKLVKPHVIAECERLYKELRALRPNVVVAAGGTPLWALTPYDKIGKWRGSILESDAIPGLKVIPLYHPAGILRMYDWRFITVQDYRRVRKEALSADMPIPDWTFTIDPSYQDVIDYLQGLIARANAGPLRLVTDVEIKRNEIICVGIATSKKEAFCIPFYHLNGLGLFRWSIEEHIEVVRLLQVLFRHKNLLLCNQNLSFDIQYFFWRFNCWPKCYHDTMIAHNVLFPGLKKSLDFQASMYCQYYRYWKDDGKFWDKPIDFPQLWRYNCMDCVYTFEIWEVQEEAIVKLNLAAQADFQMRRQFQPAMRMMLRGVKVNKEKKRPLLHEVTLFCKEMNEQVTYLACRELTGEKGGFSPYKLQKFFYKDLALPPVFNRKQGKSIITCDDEALKKLKKKEALLGPLIDRVNMIRSYKTAHDVCNKRLDPDGRWRTSYNMAGTVTYRWASSENPFNSGLNLMNLTIGKDIL
jgi:uracil-DNA glycosylase family 4